MNKTFKVIWNHSTQTWTAVSELAGTRKKSKSIKLTAISAALLMACGTVQAATHTAADSLIAISADSAAGTTAIPAGEQAKATGKDSIAVGKKAAAGKNGNVEGATAIGHGANAETNNSLAIGSGANVIMNANKNLNKRSIAIGSQARVEPRPDGGVSSGVHDAIAIGTRAMATAGNSVVIGRDARSKRGLVATFQSGENTVAIGSNASADWGSSIAIGANSRTIVGNGIAIGRDATAMYKIDNLANDGEGLPFTSMALGEKATSIGGASIAAGIETKSAGVKSVAVGNKAFANGLQSIAIGDKTYSSDRSSIAMGAYAETGWNSARQAIAIGRRAHAATTDASAFGVETFAGGVRSIASGRKAAAYGNQALAIGSDDNGQYNNGAMAIGDNAAALGTKARAIGQQTIAFGNDSVAGVTEAESNAINAAYNTYRSAYNTYSNLNKAVNSADADNYAAKTNLSTEAQNLRLLINRYAETGTIYQAENGKIKDELTKAGITFSDLTTLAGKLTASGKADVGNAQPMLDNEALINKIAAIKNTETGEANEHLGYLVNLAKRLQNGITKAKTAQTALNTAQTAKTAGKAAYDEAEKVFKATYGSGKSKTGAIAIGRSSLAAAEKSVALGDDADVVQNDSRNAFAAGASAKINGTSPNTVVIGANTTAGLTGYSTIDKVKRYATIGAPNATAVGSSSEVVLEKGSSFGYNNKVRGKGAGAFGVDNIVGERLKWTATGEKDPVTGRDTASVSPVEGQTGENSFVVGSNNWVWAKNVMVLGNNVRVYGIGRRLENRENAVVLGNNSDGEPTVKKVNSANVNGMVYSGFKGNLGATKTDGSEAEKADLALQGRFVSIGAPTKKIDKTITIADGKTNTTTVTTNLITGEESTTTASANTKDSDVAGTSTETVYGERQIKHVAAGEISSTSTDAINGSQLYAVASGLRDAFPVVYTDKDGKKLVKYPDGQYYPEGTVNINGKYYPAGTTADNVTDATEEVTPVTATNVIASMNNPSSDAANAGGNVTLTNVAPGANTYEFDKDGNPLVNINGKYYAQGDVENGAPKKGVQEAEKATDEQKDPYENAATDLANLEGSKNSNALTVADAKNLGWVVSATGNDYANSVQNAHQVNFVGVGNVDVDGYDQDGVRTLSISVDSPIDYTSTKAVVDGAEIDVVKANDGKWYPKDQVDEEGNPKENAKSVPADSIVKKGAVLSDSDAENNPYRNESAYTYQTDNAGNITIAPKTYADLSKENGYNKDEIKPGTGGVQLGNVGWATNPDQAVNKDQLDQTVNKSGFFVQQNGKTTVENAANKGETDPAKSEKVTPNDVVNFVNGNGTVIKAVTKRDEVTGVDTTTVSVDMDTKSLSNDMPVVYTDAAGNKLKKDGGKYYPADAVNIGGKYYPAGTTADNVANATEVAPVTATNVIASMNNPSSDAANAGGNVTLTNVAPGANTYEFDKDGNPLVNINGKYYAQGDVENGAPKKGVQEAEKATDEQKDPYENAATDLANLEGSKNSNALTVADAKNLGWVVSADSEDGKGYAAPVTNANEVRFNGKNGIKVTGNTDLETGIRNINIELEKSDVVKAGEYKIGDKTYVNVDGKLYDKDSIDPKTDKPKADAAPSNYTVEDGKVIDNTDAANPKEIAGVDNGSNFVDGNTVYKAIQESGWTVGKVKDALSDGTFKNGDEKVNPNDEVRFADGKGITVKTATVDAINAKGEKQTTTVVKFDTDLPIDYANVKNEAGDNLKQANDGKWYKEADVNADGTLMKPTDGKAPEAQTPVKTGATLSDANSNVGKNPYRTAIEDKAMAAAIKKVRGENPTATVEQLLPKVLEEAAKQAAELEKAEKAGQDKDVINPGKDGVQLNNVGWAENPDQAVNKDQLDQTVNKSGFFVQQNGKTTVENAASKDETDPARSEKVTPNDVVNFVNGNGTVIKAVTTRDKNGVDTTTVSVDVDTSKLVLPKGANTIAYNDAGEQIVKVDGKYYKPSELQNGKPTATATAQTPAAPAAGKPLEAAKDGLADLAHSDSDNLLTVKDAQNLGWVVSTSDNKAAAPVKNADVVDFKAEASTGLTVKGAVAEGKMTVTVGNDYIKANATGEAAKAAEATGTNSVAIGGNSNAAVENAVAIGNGATVGAEAAKGSVAIGAGAQAGKAHTGAYSLDPSATVAGKPSDATRVVSVGSEGNEAQIQNVAAGVVSEKSTDAVNGSQLHATNQSINRLGDTVNNIGGNVTRLSDKVDNMDRDYRAGIAGSNAAASLPQVYLPGKSMVAAAAGTFKGQNALAVGYSSISDNGKLIWKAQANLNSRADVGVGVGIGYLW